MKAVPVSLKYGQRRNGGGDNPIIPNFKSPLEDSLGYLCKIRTGQVLFFPVFHSLIHWKSS